MSAIIDKATEELKNARINHRRALIRQHMADREELLKDYQMGLTTYAEYLKRSVANDNDFLKIFNSYEYDSPEFYR